jgi:hypothetical protein
VVPAKVMPRQFQRSALLSLIKTKYLQFFQPVSASAGSSKTLLWASSSAVGAKADTHTFLSGPVRAHGQPRYVSLQKGGGTAGGAGDG